MNELLKNHPDFVKMGDLTRISEYNFSQVWRFLTGFDIGNGRGMSNPTDIGYSSTGLNRNSYPILSRLQPLFGDLDPSIIENYRRNRVTLHTVQVTGILALKQNA
jgi:hypothetical protein